jgi:hypothetical protein
MTNKTKINKIIKVALAIIMLFNLVTAQTKNNQVLDLFDGVVKVDASTGNIAPSKICDSTYFQSPSVKTLNNIILSTPLNTELTFNTTMFNSNFSPLLELSEAVQTACIQSIPNYGELFKTPTNVYNLGPNYRQPSFDLSTGSYSPPQNFKGIICFDMFLRYRGVFVTGEGQAYFNKADTNVAQVKIQVGGSTSSTCGPDPVVGLVGSPFPSFFTGLGPSFDNSLGSVIIGSTTILGSYLNNMFVPDPSQIIPLNATLGLTNITFLAGSDGFYPIQTNFSTAPVSGGGVIIINAASQASSSLQSSSSSTSFSSSSLSLSSNSANQVLIKPLELNFTKNYTRNSGVLSETQKRDALDITDPYVCEQQVVTGNVKYTGDKNNLNPVSLKIKGINGNNNSYTSNPVVNEAGDYESDVKNVKNGNYEVEYSISDKSGNTASGSYTFEKKDVCIETTVVKNSNLVQSKPQTQVKTLSLARTGGTSSKFSFAPIALGVLFFTFLVSCVGRIGKKEVK